MGMQEQSIRLHIARSKWEWHGYVQAPAQERLIKAERYRLVEWKRINRLSDPLAYYSGADVQA
jgi:hypothetical protein